MNGTSTLDIKSEAPSKTAERVYIRRPRDLRDSQMTYMVQIDSREVIIICSFVRHFAVVKKVKPHGVDIGGTHNEYRPDSCCRLFSMSSCPVADFFLHACPKWLLASYYEIDES